MRLLFLTPFPPYPPDGDGTKLIIWNLARELAQQHELSLVCFRDVDESIETIRQVKTCFRDVETISVERGLTLKLHALIRSLAGGRPYAAEKFFNTVMYKRVADIVREGQFDAVHVDTYVMAQYFQGGSNVRWIVAPHDSRSLTLEELHRCTPFVNIAGRLYLSREARLMSGFERTMYACFDSCVVVAEPDREHLLSLNRELPVVVIRNGVRECDLGWMPPVERHSLVFVGDMGYLPNEQAVLSFASHIFPGIRSRVSDATFYVVGRHPSHVVRKLQTASSSIIVTGEVSDVREYIRRCAVSVAPLKHGTGVKNKILDALALGRPVVAFRSACSGLANGHEDVVVRVDSDSEMVKEAVRLLDTESHALAELGMLFVQKHHSWKAAALQYERLYRGEEY